jgi:Family of unknown function (DUF6657)
MAEIKSTMEKVLERAAQMAAAAGDGANTEDLDRLGMRMAAEYLSKSEENLLKTLQKQPAENQMAIRAGMARTLLRNIVLPRDKDLVETGTKALQGLVELGQSSRDISSICSEIQKILGQYNQHKEQLKQQLDQAIRAQLEQKMGNRGEKLSGQVSINPAMHPQYQEEWARMQSDLNNQYNQALDQRKNMIQQRLAP